MRPYRLQPEPARRAGVGDASARQPLASGALALTLVALLGGCGGPPASDSWFPLQPGQRQDFVVRYDTDDDQDDEAITLQVLRRERLDEREVAVRRLSSGIEYYLVEDEQGIRRVATRADIDRDPTPDAEPRWVLKQPYQVGTEWTTPTVPYLIKRRNEYPRELKYSHSAPMTWRIEAVDEVVQTAQGRFSPCLRVEGKAKVNLYTDGVNGFNDVPLVSREWYCKGQGLVKWERIERVPKGFLLGGSLVAELADPTAR